MVPKLTGRSRDAEISRALADINQIQSALARFEMTNGKYPTSDMGLLALIERPNVTPELTKWRKELETSVLPKDPWGNEYVYRCPGDKNPDGYDLYSKGPDAQDDTEDDVYKP